MAATAQEPDVGHDPTVQVHRPAPGISRWQKTIGIAGLVVVLWIGDSLFDTITSGGVGPGGGQGDHTSPSGPATTQSTGGGDQAPAGGNDGSHDPSQFNHG